MGKQADLMDAYDALGTNKLYGYAPDKIEAMKNRSIDMLQGEYVVGRIDDTFTKKGKNAALEAVRTAIDNNPDLDIGDADRNHLHNMAMSRLSYLTDEQQSNIAALKPTVQMQVAKLRAGNGGPDAVSDREIGQTVTQLTSLGDFKGAQDLQAAQMIADRMNAFRNLSPGQKSNTLLGAANAGVGGPIASGLNTEQAGLQYFVSKGWSPTQAAGIMGNLVHESGGRLNPGAIAKGDGSDGSDSIGIGQWNQDRATALKAFAATQGKSWNDYGTQLAFVQHELETNESAAAQRLKGAQTPQDAASAFALGYERPQGFETGDLAKTAGGQNRLDQTLRLAGGGASGTPIAGAAGVATVGQPFTDAEEAANPWLRTEYRARIQLDDASQVRFAKTQFEALDNAIKFTGTPSPEMIPQAAAALQIADSHPDELGEHANKLRAALMGAPAGFAAASSPTAGADILSQANDLARTGDPVGVLTAQSIRSSLEAGQKLLARDQFEYGVNAEWLKRKPMPLDFSSPAALGQSVTEHALAAAKISTMPGVQPVSALTQAETAQVKTVMQTAPVDGRLAVLSAISNANMPEPVLKATLAGLGREPTMMPLAWAGSLSRFNAGAARDIVAGQAMMQAEPKLAPPVRDLSTEMAKAIPLNDLPASGKGSLGGARESMTGAVQALYSKYSHDAGDLTGVFNQARFDQAVETVSGGIRSYRGSSFVAPWYGATQEDTDAAVRGLTDADFRGAQTTDGKPFPVSALKPSFVDNFTYAPWRLQSAGDGKYLVFSGSDQARQYLGAASIPSVDQAATSAAFVPGSTSSAGAALDTYARRNPVPMGKFVLDLGSKRQAVERSRLRLALPSSAWLPNSDPIDDELR